MLFRSANNIGNIGIQDAKERMAMLGDATNKLTSMQAGNISGQNTYNKDVMDMLNKAVAADQTARAQVEAANSQGGSLFLLAAISLYGSLTPQEAKATEQFANASKFTRLKEVRKIFGSENAVRGYTRISDALSPKIESSIMGKKVVYYALAKPVAKRGLVAKMWGRVFALIGKVV